MQFNLTELQIFTELALYTNLIIMTKPIMDKTVKTDKYIQTLVIFFNGSPKLYKIQYRKTAVAIRSPNKL